MYHEVWRQNIAGFKWHLLLEITDGCSL